MAEAAEVDSGGLVNTLKDLFAGAAGGVAQVLLGELLSFCDALKGFNFGHVHINMGFFYIWSIGRRSTSFNKALVLRNLLERSHILLSLISSQGY